LTAFVGVVVAALAQGLQGRVADRILEPLFTTAAVVAVVGLAVGGIAYSRRSGAEQLTRGIWSGNAADRDRALSAKPGVTDAAASRRVHR
jgi:hypothetical protein